MPSALWLLIRMVTWGRVRRALRNMRTVRGAIIGIVGASVIVLWIVPAAFYLYTGGLERPEYIRETLPFIMLLFATLALVSSTEQAIYFSPAEVNFLFPAPFSRRQLLVYRLFTFFIASALTAIIFSLFIGRVAPFFFVAYAGLTLAFQFLGLISIALQLITEGLALRMFTTGRRAVGFVLLAVIGIAGYSIAGQFDFEELYSSFNDLRSHPLLKAVLFPFEPFGQFVAAERLWPDAFLWGSICITMNLAVASVIIALDINYTEASVRVSQQVYDRLQRIRSGGIMKSNKASAKLSLPVFPRLGGAGVHAWRQVLQALRLSRTMLIFLSVFVFTICAVAVSTDALADPSLGWSAVGALLLWFTFFFANAMRFDFRNDIEQMDILKSLPVNTYALVLGQLFAPILITSFFQAIVVVASGFIFGPLWVAGALLAFIVPINAIIYAVENITFLIYPTRVVATSPGDFQFLGRQILVMIAKMVVITVGMGFAGSIAIFAILLGADMWVIGVMVWCVAVFEFLVAVPIAVMAFNRFDPSVHTPA